MFAASEKFLAKNAGTSIRKIYLRDVAKRLKEMTVDINTVQLAKNQRQRY